MKILDGLVDRSTKLRSKGLNAVVEMEDILAIAEAFRELEQLKEQYLNYWAKAEKECSSLEMNCVELERKPKRLLPLNSVPIIISGGGFDAERRQKAISAAKRRARVIALGLNPGCLD